MACPFVTGWDIPVVPDPEDLDSPCDVPVDNLAFVTSITAIDPLAANGVSDTAQTGDVTLTFITPGDDTWVLYNEAGVPGADLNFTWDYVAGVLTVEGQALCTQLGVSDLLTSFYDAENARIDSLYVFGGLYVDSFELTSGAIGGLQIVNTDEDPSSAWFVNITTKGSVGQLQTVIDGSSAMISMLQGDPAAGSSADDIGYYFALLAANRGEDDAQAAYAIYDRTFVFWRGVSYSNILGETYIGGIIVDEGNGVVSYAPAEPSNWASLPPTDLAAAVDRIVAWIALNFPLLAPP